MRDRLWRVMISCTTVWIRNIREVGGIGVLYEAAFLNETMLCSHLQEALMSLSHHRPDQGLDLVELYLAQFRK